MEELDFVVIGAGWFGLAAAKTFHQIDPEKSLAVLDSSSTLGGVWAQHRLYPGLKTNNLLGMYEYPDFPMDTETFGVKPGEFIPGPVCHKYLTKYAEKFDIIDKIRCGNEVESAEHQENGGWILTVLSDVTDGATPKETKILAKKLVVATGLTSQPFLPHIDGQESYGAPLFHCKDFLQHADTLDKAKRATVFGGTKSAWDAVYAYATKGVKVDWVIRASGHGPCWFTPSHVTPLKRWLEALVLIRFFTWFSPCIWGFADGYAAIRSFFNGTAIGRAITDAFWWFLSNDVIRLNKYDSHPETAKLKPWTQAMFSASSFSILSYSTDIFELVRNGSAKIHIADITHLSPHAVHLSNDTVLSSDALSCATGWKILPAIKFLPEGIDKELGIPHAPSPSDPYDFIEKADKEILEKFPRLKDQPVINKRYAPLLDNKGMSTTDHINPSTPLTPYMLHRFMVPPSPNLLARRDIAFAGFLMHFTIVLSAHIQALWINAYFRGGASIPDCTSAEAMDKLKYETVLFSRFGKWRYSGANGARYPDFVFDVMPYHDLLCRDLGIAVHRKKGMLAELFEPYGPEEYANVVSEWMEKQNSVKHG
ncbi:uncharacterized protein BCR38DRAFT_402501 [Pseudomassariella vexata]|uniref:Uncharacterized protein n=1 Tax=Pseudomassariella vexata TaxID=1141098 RepID=A0A1Y2DAP3_9PEZI|nr:uncharacterized protein BCR38DRAFT_402501 [Pseudomassariella vexata]ORY56341.1 hypothetical protein BCR38DRAFT_402501 [Pseudomassariella vexata]